MSFIEQAFKNWTDSISEAYRIVFSDPADWNPDVWRIVETLNAAMILVASGLLVMFFFLSVVKSCTNYKEMRQMEFWAKPLVRLALTNLVMVMSMSVMLNIFAIAQGLMSKIGKTGAASYDISVPEAISEALDDVSFWKQPILGIIGLLLLLFCLVLGIALLVTVWGRFLRLYIYTAVAPVFIAFGAGEMTQSVAFTFFKSWINICFQGIVIVLALVIYTSLITSDNSEAVRLVQNGALYSGVLLFVRDFSVGALVTLGLCKGADQIVSKMTGY